jgi:hypothetical protein
MRLVDDAGRRLGVWGRLVRAPISILPFAWVSDEMQRRMPWRVAIYAPSRQGRVARSAVVVAAALSSVAWGIESSRPSIGGGDASTLAHGFVEHDMALRRSIGPVLDYEVVRISRRAHERGFGQRGTFELRVRGFTLQQDMMVHAVKVDGRWSIEEIHDIDIYPVDNSVAKRTPSASRTPHAPREDGSVLKPM